MYGAELSIGARTARTLLRGDVNQGLSKLGPASGRAAKGPLVCSEVMTITMYSIPYLYSGQTHQGSGLRLSYIFFTSETRDVVRETDKESTSFCFRFFLRF